MALRYVPNKNKLSVVVMECKNLKKMDVLGLSGKALNYSKKQKLFRSLRKNLLDDAEQKAGKEEDDH